MVTIKQKKAALLLSETIGKNKSTSMGQIMAEAGYSESTSKTPQRLTDSRGWKELMKEYFPDSRIQLLLDKAMKEYEEGTKIEDKRAFLGLMDMMIKLKDKYPQQKSKAVGLFEILNGLEEN